MPYFLTISFLNYKLKLNISSPHLKQTAYNKEKYFLSGTFMKSKVQTFKEADKKIRNI